MSPERARRRKSRIKWAAITLVAVVAAAGVALGAYLYVRAVQERELRNNLIVSCEKNGNPLREVLQRRIENEIKQSQNIKLLETFFPNIPKKELAVLLAKSIREKRQELSEVAPLHCQEAYSK